MGMDVYNFRLANLLRLKKERAAGVTKRLAELIETDPNYLTQVERGLQGKQIGSTLARKVERSLKLPRGWMDQDHSGSDLVNAEPSALQLRHVPEIAWVQAGKFSSAEDFRALRLECALVPTDRPVSRVAFALRIRGDSMTAPDGRGYPDGCRIIVDPAIEAAPGRRVVVRLDGVDEATCKELVVDAGRYYLKPLNPRYPVIPLPEDARILGVVVQTIIDE